MQGEKTMIRMSGAPLPTQQSLVAMFCDHTVSAKGETRAWGNPSTSCNPSKSGDRGNHCTVRSLCAHCALLLDYVPPEEPLGTPLGNTLRIRRPKLDRRGP